MGPGSPPPTKRGIVLGVELACAETCPRSIFSAILDGDSSDATSGYQYCGNLLTIRVHQFLIGCGRQVPVGCVEEERQLERR